MQDGQEDQQRIFILVFDDDIAATIDPRNAFCPAPRKLFLENLRRGFQSRGGAEIVYTIYWRDNGFLVDLLNLVNQR